MEGLRIAKLRHHDAVGWEPSTASTAVVPDAAIVRTNRRIGQVDVIPPLEHFESLDPMFTIGLDLPCEMIPTVELEKRDRDDMRLLAVTKAEIEMAHEAALVAHIPNLSDITLVRENPLRLFL